MSDYLKKHFERAIELYQPNIEKRLNINIGVINLIPHTLENSLKPGLSDAEVVLAKSSKLINVFVACWNIVMPACAGHRDEQAYIYYSPSPVMRLMPFLPWDWIALHEIGHLAHDVIIGHERHTRFNKEYGRRFSEQFATYIADVTLIEEGNFPWHKRFLSGLADYSRKKGNIERFQSLGTDWPTILNNEDNYLAR